MIGGCALQCRGKRAYTIAVNELQMADPYDPWLHREWARLLALELRFAESMKHLEVRRAPTGRHN